jgi:membrane protease subunit (stomatin/prohibitin family)
VEIQKQADGTVKMQAALTNNGTVVKGATVSVKINNQTPEVALVDDGKHGDGTAGDGIYGATTEKLAAGEHFIEARATANGLQAAATTVLTIRAAN